jgi:hypothetical protein
MLDAHKDIGWCSWERKAWRLQNSTATWALKTAICACSTQPATLLPVRCVP